MWEGFPIEKNVLLHLHVHRGKEYMIMELAKLGKFGAKNFPHDAHWTLVFGTLLSTHYLSEASFQFGRKENTIFCLFIYLDYALSDHHPILVSLKPTE